MRRLLAAGVVLGALTLGFSTPATARPTARATAPTTTAGGVVRLLANPDHTGSSQTVLYQECVGNFATRATVGSFDNRPPAGCEVVLVKGASTFELCAGRGVVPTYYRNASIVHVQPGTSIPCAFRTAR